MIKLLTAAAGKVSPCSDSGHIKLSSTFRPWGRNSEALSPAEAASKTGFCFKVMTDQRKGTRMSKMDGSDAHIQRSWRKEIHQPGGGLGELMCEIWATVFLFYEKTCSFFQNNHQWIRTYLKILYNFLSFFFFTFCQVNTEKQKLSTWFYDHLSWAFKFSLICKSEILDHTSTAAACLLSTLPAGKQLYHGVLDCKSMLCFSVYVWKVF